MHRIIDKIPWLNNLQAPLIGIFSMVAAYFDSTITFIYALMSAFVFNILAGMRADNVSLKKLGNFSLPKFKDSLIELMVICSVTYLLKGIMDLMKLDEKSTYAVHILLWEGKSIDENVEKLVYNMKLQIQELLIIPMM